ncbi:hypothetical protein [Agrobacterium rosae]|uniref:hypothetical protein n=1 Tax=Agrobacterium rosae TaxID=1972867 RepID=UPI003B9DDBC4
MASTGQKIRHFLQDEQNICEESLKIIENDLVLFDELSAFYLEFLNRPRELQEGETKFHILSSLCRSQLLKAVSDLLRLHVSSAFTSSRIGAEAALYGLLMSMGRLSEQEYLESEQARTNAIKKIGKDLKNNAESFPKILLAVREARNQHGVHAHADPLAFANRLIKNDEGTISYTVFQEVENDIDYRMLFLRILWDGLMYLRAFTHIQQTVYDEDVSELNVNLDVMKAKLETWKRALMIAGESKVTIALTLAS